MSEELAFKILKQADIDYGCDNCPRTDKNKSCIGCLDKSKEILIKSYEKLQQENKQLKDGLHKILDLNKRAINCENQKVTVKYLLKQYDLIYETLGELQPGLMKGYKE